jgi:hypothetical protein
MKAPDLKSIHPESMVLPDRQKKPNDAITIFDWLRSWK